MAYSPAPLALDRSKPAPWNVDGAFVAPEYQGLWRNLAIFHPLWEGSAPPYDVAGDAHAVFPSTPPTWTPTKAGIGLSFDESNDYYTIPDNPRLDLIGEWTLVFYMRVPDITGSDFLYFYSWGPFGTADSLNAYITEAGQSPAGTLFVQADDTIGDIQRRQSFTVFPSDDFKLVALRNQGTSGTSMHWFVDGVDVTNEGVGSSGVLAHLVRADDLEIGRREDGDANRYFGGEISWWGKWDRALSESEMQLLASDPFALSRPNWDYLSTAFSSTSLFATGDGTIVDVVNENDAATPLSPSIDDDPASPDDNDWVNNAVDVT